MTSWTNYSEPHIDLAWLLIFIIPTLRSKGKRIKISSSSLGTQYKDNLDYMRHRYKHIHIDPSYIVLCPYIVHIHIKWLCQCQMIDFKNQVNVLCAESMYLKLRQPVLKQNMSIHSHAHTKGENTIRNTTRHKSQHSRGRDRQICEFQASLVYEEDSQGSV